MQVLKPKLVKIYSQDELIKQYAPAKFMLNAGKLVSVKDAINSNSYSLGKLQERPFESLNIDDSY